MLHGQAREQLTHLGERYGIRYVEQEESCTSKASFLDSNEIPVWNGTPHVIAFSGQRIQRGLYRIADGRPVNAEVNGAANILRKSNHRPDHWLALGE